MSDAQVATVELVLFDVDGTRYGVDMTQVLRIDRHVASESVGTPLGRPREGRRALIFSSPTLGERSLAIDSVLGVRSVPIDDLRRLPPGVGTSVIAIGAWLDRDEPVLLIDLFATTLNPEAPHA